MTVVGETRVMRDFAEQHLCRSQQRFHHLNPPIHDILMRRYACRCFEQSRKVKFAHVHDARQFFNGERTVAKMQLNIVIDQLELVNCETSTRFLLYNFEKSCEHHRFEWKRLRVA